MSTTIVPSPTSVLRLGHAHGDITPPVGIYHRMWGAARHDRATGVHRPLQADMLVFEPAGRPEERLVRVQLDHVLLDDGQTDEAVAGLVRTAGVDRDRVHVTFWRRPWSATPRGVAAWPPTATTATTSAASGSPASTPTRPPKTWCSRPGSPASTGTPRLHLVHYACHPTTLAWDNSLLSPDFVGAARQVVSDHTGTPCVFFQGLCGELGPRDGFTGDTEVADRNGRQLGFAALSALAALGPPGHDFAYQGPVLSGATIGTWGWTPMDGPRAEAVRRWSGGRFQVDLPLKPLPDAGELRADLDRHTREQARADAAGDDLAARDAGARAERCRRWRRRFPDRTVLVIPMAGDPQLAYLLPRDRYGLGLYQEEPSCLAPGCLEAVLEAMTEAVEELTGSEAVRQGG